MRTISDKDCSDAIRLLKAFASTPGESIRERNDRRMASMLSKKLARCKSVKLSSGKAPTA